MPVGFTSQRSVQVLGFEDCCLLTPLRRLIRFLFVRPAFCLGLPSDSQLPATPLPLANTSPCRACRGLSPPSHPLGHHSQAGCADAQRAMPGAHFIVGLLRRPPPHIRNQIKGHIHRTFPTEYEPLFTLSSAALTGMLLESYSKLHN